MSAVVQSLIWGSQMSGTKVPLPLAEKILCSLVQPQHFRAPRAGADLQWCDTVSTPGTELEHTLGQGTGSAGDRVRAELRRMMWGTKQVTLQVVVVLISCFFCSHHPTGVLWQHSDQADGVWNYPGWMRSSWNLCWRFCYFWKGK